ncbi:hypothetical protein [Dokdonella sp.]|uniref:hypothetical protein n=1 Tax=Dokdonella sp. TaxID=2291710 RepID=UPI0025BF0251|nr:hypothetical protein [Dokdonella sp.]MBX3688031.1 hypothetical protein [Dokdonella sp.]
MKQAFGVTAALALLAVPALACAGNGSFLHNYDVPGAAAAVHSPSAKVAGTTTTPGTPMARANRNYPPSCASYPLPDKPSGTTWSATVPALATTSVGTTIENLVVTVWRMPCSSSGQITPYNASGAKNAMTLVRIDRADDSLSTMVPLRPRLLFSQGSTSYGVIRLAAEPNTAISEASYAAAMPGSATYVLENYPVAGMPQFDFKTAFKLNVIGGTGTNVDIDVPAYDPTSATYPDAFAPIPIDGYAAAQWYNAARNEGVIVQVAENFDGAHPTRRQLIIDLLTKDAAGNPFWIVGGAAFDPIAGGVRSLDVPVSFLTANNGIADWGTVHLVLANCNRMDLAFTPIGSLPQGIPSITGTISYDRLLSANGMLCE